MKGILFSFILVITMLSLITFIFVQRGLVYTYSERLAASTRINSMMNFYNSILYDGGKALDITTKRASFASINHVITNGAGLEKANDTIAELVMNGTINGTPQILMYSMTIVDWKNRIESLGMNESFDTVVSLGNVTVSPYDSWHIAVTMDVRTNLSDMRGVANITKSDTITQVVSIEDFEDPVYPLNTIGRATNVIARSPYIGNYTNNLVSGTGDNGWFRGMSVVFPKYQNLSISAVTDKGQKVLVTDSTSGIEGMANQFGAIVSESAAGGITVALVDNATNAMGLVPNNTNVLVNGDGGKVWHIENIVDDANLSYYHQSVRGGSFLDRLEGKLTIQNKYNQTGSVIGLESFVNKNTFSSLGVPVTVGKSNVDYLYFSNDTYTTYTVKGMDSTFRIDKEIDLNNTAHDVIYGVNQLE